MGREIAAQEGRNQVDGTVSAIMFRNEENGYTVLKLDCGERGEITVVGCMPSVAPGETLELEGSWGRHPTFGEQFKAEVVSRRMPVGEKAVFEYLASGVIQGIRMGLARQIVDRFGEDSLAVLENEPDRLAEIRGISPVRARSIGKAFREKMGMRRLTDFLAAHGLPDDVLTCTIEENKAVLSRIDPREELTEDTVRTALEDYLAGSRHIPRAAVR